MQPRPMAETSRFPFPSFRFCIFFFDIVVVRLNHSGVAGVSGITCGASLAIVRSLSRSCGKTASLQAAAELCGRHANHAPEDLSKMARACVTDFRLDLDECPGRFAG